MASAVQEGLALLMHVPSRLPTWALQAYPGLGTTDGLHSIAYDLDHPQVRAGGSNRGRMRVRVGGELGLRI